MKVKELIAILNKIDGNTDVVIELEANECYATLQVPFVKLDTTEGPKLAIPAEIIP